MLFSKRVHLLLEIDEGADTLRFNDRCGRSSARYQRAWRVFDRDGMTEVLYELVAQPDQRQRLHHPADMLRKAAVGASLR